MVSYKALNTTIKIFKLSSNRTFMELKSKAKIMVTFKAEGSNRTFMELK